MRKRFPLALALCGGLLLYPGAALRAQSLDPTFLPTTLKAPFTASSNSGVKTLAVQPDGKILVGGAFDFVGGTLTGKLQRFNPDGTVDATFNAGTGANAPVTAVAVQPDGKILAAGGFNTFNGTAVTGVVRLNANGSLDNTFSSQGSGAPVYSASLAVQPDGKILVGGADYNLARSEFMSSFVRLNANGTRDTGFTPSTGADSGYVYSLLVQPDGKILVGGSFSTFNGQFTGSLMRLNADGSLDTSFSFAGGMSIGFVRSLARQASGKLLVAGTLTVNNLAQSLVRLLSSGAVDNTFTAGAGTTPGLVMCLTQQSSGAVLLGGTFTEYNGVPRNGLARVSADGVLDAGFAPAAGPNGMVQALAETSGGQLLIGGNFTQYGGSSQPALARLSTGGTLDAAFAPVLESRGTIYQAFPLSNGQLLVTGYFSTFNGTALPGSAGLPRRLNADGSLDPSYAAGAGGSVQAVLPNGSLYVLDYAPNPLRRLLPGGALDNGFTLLPTAGRTGNGTDIGGGLNGAVVQPDGKVLVYGVFTSYNGVPRNGLARLLPDGTLDASFTPPASASLPSNTQGIRTVRAVFVLNSGKILYKWAGYLGSNQEILTQLNADGTVDNTFSTGTGPNPATGAGWTLGVLPQPDGRLLVWGGRFTSFNGQPTPYGMTRLTTTGAVDPTFTGLSDYYFPRYVQADGSILATTGNITGNTLGAGPASTLVRLHPDGSPDASFAPVPIPASIFGGDDHLAQVTPQPADGKLLLSGSFRYVAGQPRIGLARLTNAPLATQPAGKRPQPLTLYPNPARQQVTVQLPAGAEQLRLLDLQGRLVQLHRVPARQTAAALHLTAVPTGLYLVQVVGSAGLYQQRVVVTH
ncbi:T9SS type A sorting domain-containing protein [Hymenobacter edaphi]|uniref:Secretion system C-terminal sorting domain-containing protein n=1 Tax=Hymenobacter edaphi TaxID=2211146 RepID=A0A328BXP1_9BACT|nr:T9SS type A sorting domain-containing protein [Hymenobacter edaphi]RAK69878.1 hypothetical protein DLM85_03205 [Hymenobacter edaphi]